MSASKATEETKRKQTSLKRDLDDAGLGLKRKKRETEVKGGGKVSDAVGPKRVLRESAAEETRVLDKKSKSKDSVESGKSKTKLSLATKDKALSDSKLKVEAKSKSKNSSTVSKKESGGSVRKAAAKDVLDDIFGSLKTKKKQPVAESKTQDKEKKGSDNVPQGKLACLLCLLGSVLYLLFNFCIYTST